MCQCVCSTQQLVFDFTDWSPQSVRAFADWVYSKAIHAQGVPMHMLMICFVRSGRAKIHENSSSWRAVK